METCVQTGSGKIATELQMTVLQNETSGDSDVQVNDELEELSNSLREVIQDQTVQPKLQCLMMDPTFSMVTVQREDSGIMWETAFSHCSNPWTSRASSRGCKVFSNKTECCKIPKSTNAGKITFIMDEVHTLRKKKDKEQMSESEHVVASRNLHELTDRPAMVEVSMPNMKDVQNKQVTIRDPRKEKEQRLFRLVSEGSEILNIVVPAKVATVDEEESKKLKDNLTYIEESHVQPVDIEGRANCPDMVIPEPEPQQTDTQTQEKELQDIVPVLPFKLPNKRPVIDSDYFDMFTLLDGNSSGVSDKKEDKHHQPHNMAIKCFKSIPVKPVMKTEVTPHLKEDIISSGEIVSELLDEVFYGGTEKRNHSQSGEGCQWNKDELSKFIEKESGCVLFSNEDTVLTPIFLSQGPPKINDPSLLEEPKAMAFLYTDLYEDALGTKKKEEDTVSVTSEKSFHSKDSESDSNCYLEKFVLKDETPLVEMIEATTGAAKTDGFRMWSEEMFELARLNQIGNEPENDPEEDVTDFFRNSASSSPCEDVKQPNLSLDENIEIKCRRVIFEDEIPQKHQKENKSEQAPGSTQVNLNKQKSQEKNNSIETALEGTDMTEKLITDKLSLEDDAHEITYKQEITGIDAFESHKTSMALEMPLTLAEQQATGLSPRCILGLSSLEPADPEEDMAEEEFMEECIEGDRTEVETALYTEEERHMRTPPMTGDDTNVPPDNDSSDHEAAR
ncbi:cardiomyopathy-associated protein 5 [Sardina pilchardus]|uniref:cardiomyopathy-associated protein 5 n=1 Tax=Sardina pilchardus TaxID=27697 RepID=UPI002E1329A8